MSRKRLSIVILISGKGTNLQAIIDAVAHGLPVDILAVISNHSDAYGLRRAEQAKIPTQVIRHEDYADRQTFDAALIRMIDQYAPQLVVLAGFMRKLGHAFVAHYAGRCINIHPSLLPKYPGLNTHQQVLKNREVEHGVSVHYVTEVVDQGPMICQAQLMVLPDDTEESLKTRIHELEHVIYPQVLAWIAAGRLLLRDDQVLLDGQALPKAGKLLYNHRSG